MRSRNTLTLGEPHTIKLVVNEGYSHRDYGGGVGNILIYKESG